MDPARYLEVLSERSRSLLGAAAGSWGRKVPACPEWTVADLVVHVGSVWGWAAEIVTTKKRADRSTVAPGVLEGSGGDALGAWAAEQSALLLDALGASDPDDDCWTFGLPRAVRFWFRRQALETTLHAWDAEGAVGTPGTIDGEVAADGVDEHLAVMVTRAVRGHPEAWSGEAVHLHRTDGPGEWTVRLGPDGETAIERGHAKGDLALRGTAEALWLWCAGRSGVDAPGIERFGDEDIAARWAAEMRF